MSLKRLIFDKLWTSSADFPTLEENEEQVRADFQYHPDAIKTFLNEVLLPALEKYGVEQTLCTADPDALKYLKVNEDGDWLFSADGEVWEKFHKKGGGIWLAPNSTSVDGLSGLIDISTLSGNSNGDAPTTDDILVGDMVLCSDGGILIVAGFATNGGTVYVTCTGGASDDPADGAAINIKGETGDVGVFTPDGENGPLPVGAGGTGAADAAGARANLNAAAKLHAEQHATGGADPITPASIGAADADHDHILTALLGTLSVAKGGTGATTAAKARENLGITPANIGAAAASHGNHVPTKETANNAKFLRNDNTWQTVTPANIGAAAASHGTHVSYGTSATALASAASAGSANTVSRSDHKHPLPALGNCTGTLTVAKGGTGATTAAAARSNLGITPANIGAASAGHQHACTLISSGDMPAAIVGTGTTSKTYTFANAANYALYIVEGTTISGSSLTTVVVPGPLSTTAKTHQYADEGNYVTFQLYASGNNAILTNIRGSNSGVITAVYGLS